MTRWMLFALAMPVVFVLALVCAVWAACSWARDRLPWRVVVPATFALMLGCGASAVEKQVTAARVAALGIDTAGGAIELACDPDDVRERDDAQERARACLRAAEAHDALRAAWVTWVTAIAVSEDEEEWTGLLGPLVELWRQVDGFLEALGVAGMPPAPAW